MFLPSQKCSSDSTRKLQKEEEEEVEEEEEEEEEEEIVYSFSLSTELRVLCTIL